MMSTINIDARIENADWPKRTPDKMADLQVPKALARKERAIHKIADAHLEPMKMAVRKAFSLGRQAMRRPEDLQKAVNAVRKGLERYLPPAYEDLIAAVGSSITLKTLGGPGSGNFGHAGRPGKVGGSSSDGAEWTDVRWSNQEIESKLSEIESHQEYLDSKSIMDQTSGDTATSKLARDFAALDAISTILRNQQKANDDPLLQKNSRFFYHLDSTKPAGIGAALMGEVKEQILELSWGGSLVKGQGKQLMIKLFAWGRSKGATSAHGVAQWGSFPHWQKTIGATPVGRYSPISDSQEFTASIKALADKPKFDPSYAIDWIRTHTAEVADSLSKTTRDALEEALVDAFNNPDKDAAWREVLAAVGDDARAEAIAATEVMAAANAGQRAAWAQQVEDGDLTGNEKRVWVTFPDACPQCDELEGETAELDGTYADGVEGPPLHPRCRCIEELEGPRTLARQRRPFPKPDFIILAGVLRRLRTLGGAGSGNFGHAGRPGEVGGSASSGDPLAGEVPGQHTPEAAKRLIAYLEKETDETFGMHGSTKKGLTSTNDFDLVLTEPSEDELERMQDEANLQMSRIMERQARGEITEQQMMEEIYGEAPDKLTNALNKIGFDYKRTAEWLGILVTRFENNKTGHAIEIWQRGDPDKMPW